MEIIHKPEMIPLKNGKTLKTLKVTAKAGMEMPLHHSTREAVIVVLKGEANLKMPEETYALFAGMTFIIPAMVTHSLEIKFDFHAVAIMESNSKIEFES